MDRVATLLTVTCNKAYDVACHTTCSMTCEMTCTTACKSRCRTTCSATYINETYRTKCSATCNKPCKMACNRLAKRDAMQNGIQNDMRKWRCDATCDATFLAYGPLFLSIQSCTHHKVLRLWCTVAREPDLCFRSQVPISCGVLSACRTKVCILYAPSRANSPAAMSPSS